jgi:tetratricopeptide (TPR) repeat protein
MNGKNQKERSIYFESLLPYYTMGWAPIRGIIQDSTKFIDSPIPELYDLEKDFDETRDISLKTNLNIYRKQLSELIHNQESQESEEAKQNLNREALEKLKSLGYVGDSVGEKKKIFSREDDVKVLLPYYNKSVEALDLFNSGNEEKGIRLLREVITEKKNIPSAYLNLATIFKSQGRLDNAIQVLRMGFDFIPDSFQIYSSYLKYLLEANQWNEIINVFQRIPIKQAEFDPLVWNYVGVAYLNIGDFDKAIQFCEKAVSIDERYAVSYNNLGRIHLNIFNLSTNPESLQKALLNYQKVIELDPKISAAHDGLSFIFMFEEKYEKAIYHLEMALRLQPDLDNIVYNLGVSYLKNGDKTKALSFFSQFKGGNAYQQMTSPEKEKLENYILQCKEKEISY